MQAEMAQCASIDADIANRKVAELEKKLYEQKQPELGYEEQFHYMSQHIQSLEERISNLENSFLTFKK